MDHVRLDRHGRMISEENTMINFKEITLEDRNWIIQKLKEDDRQGCEFTFGNNYIWRNIYRVEVAQVHGCCVIKFDADGDDCFAYPVGAGDKQQVILDLIEDAKERGQKLRLDSILKADREQIEAWFPGRFEIKEERDGFDYIYTVEKLTNLAGKKLHGKRNHIARFKDSHTWSYEPMTTENKAECLEMNRKWCAREACKWNQDMSDELCAVREAVEHFEELQFCGGILRAEGEIVAFTIGEPLNSDTFVVHIEKAFPDIQGAYPMINQQFVTNTCQQFRYVNREDDTGAEGLRKAKLSYYPDILLQKYSAEYKG